MLLSAENDSFPRGLLFAAGLLVAFALGSTGFVRMTGLGKVNLPTAAPVESRMLRFEDRSDGAVTVFDAQDKRLIAVLAPGTNGFVRGVMRGLARNRRLDDVNDAPSFELTLWADGRVTLLDPTTHESVELEAFGKTNLNAFARLLDKRNDLP